jgi:hypothetical protein
MPLRSKAYRIAVAAVTAIGISAIAVPASTQGLFGPGKFEITHSDDRFATDGESTIVGHNNRVSKKAVGGGLYIDWHGLYLEPMAVKSHDGKIVKMGFVLHNEVQEDTMSGTLNLLGTPRKVSFLVDGTKLISADVTDGASKSDGTATYTRYLGTIGTNVAEGGVITLSTEDMAALAGARSIVLHVEGTTHNWTCEAPDIAKQFLPNVAAFYKEVIAPAS